MPLHPHNKFPLLRLKKLSVAVTLLCSLPLGVHAAGLGKLTVLSSLGQPLRAEIELTSVSPAEQGKIVAKLASDDAFRKANIDVNPVLASLHFSIEQRGTRQIVRITSVQAVNEPFIDLLLELNGANHQVREYTFLLDPPEMRKPQTAQVSPVAPVSAAAPLVAASDKPSVVVEQKPVAAPKPAAMPAPVPVPVPAAAIEDEEPAPSIVTKSAPSSLAEEIIRTGRSDNSNASNASTPTPVVATPAGKARSNANSVADKKSGDNSYHVKQGDTLGQIAGRTKDSTVSLDQMLVALYRANPDAFIGANMNRLRAGQVLTLPDASAAGTLDQVDAHGTVVAQAQDFNSYRSKLAGQVASGAASKAGESRRSGGGKVTALVQEKAPGGQAQDKLQLSKAGIGASEKAAVEDKIAADKALAEANERVKELEKNVSDLQKLLEIKNKSLADMSEQQKSAVKVDVSTPAAVPAAPMVAAAAAPVEATVAPVEAPPEAAVPPPAMTPIDKPKLAPVPVPTRIARPGFFDRIEDNPFAIPAAGLLVALLAGLGFVRVRNSKKAQTPAADNVSPPAEPLAHVQEAAGVEPEVAAVDPIVEADKYIAYGRDEQAEDILRLALKNDSNRQAIHAKLLDIYYKRRDVEAFNGIAHQLHDVSTGRGATWEAAVAMGMVLDPSNALYSGAVDSDANMMQAVDLAAQSKAAVAAAPVVQKAPAKVAMVEQEPEPEQDAGLEFDLSDFKGAEMPESASAAADMGSKIDFDLELDSGAKAAADPIPVAPPEPVAPAPAPIKLELPEPVEPVAATGLEEDESAFATEMATKLDLAEAYQEIGDKDGALELLEEVIRGGSESQVVRAKEMLSKLK